MMIVAIVFVGTVATTLTLLGRHFYMTSVAVRQGELEARAGQLLAAGQAWCGIHAEQVRGVAPGGSISLSVETLLPAGEDGRLTIERGREDGVAVLRVEVARGQLKRVLSAAIPQS